MPLIKDEGAAVEAGAAKPKRVRAPRKAKAAAAQEADNTSTINSDVGTEMTGAPGSIKKKTKASSKDSQGSVENDGAGADGEEVAPKPKRERKKKRGDPGMPPAFGELHSFCTWKIVDGLQVLFGSASPVPLVQELQRCYRCPEPWFHPPGIAAAPQSDRPFI